MEQCIHIQASDNCVAVTAWLQRNSARPSKTLAVFIHGMCDADSALMKDASVYFADEGIDGLRVCLYDGYPPSRSFTTSSLSTYAADVAAVLAWASNDYDNCIFVGHSLGAYTALSVAVGAPTLRILGVVLWDPSLDPKIIFGKTCEMASASRLLRREAAHSKSYASLLSMIRLPVKIVASRDGKRVARHYCQHLRPRSVTLDILGDADHMFGESMHRIRLIELSIEWIRELGSADMCRDAA